MFQQTKNEYRFKYLVTAITGEGIPCVYLPEVPEDKKILFTQEQKWTRPTAPDFIKKGIREYAKRVQADPNYIHPLQTEINRWADQEWERSENGIWFWNNGVPTYITGFYYWYLTAWQTTFGFPTYRETDKELSYFIKYCEEDPDSYGALLNTIRRYGKSSFMGGWATYRTTRNRNHYCGMQGENDKKIGQFYTQMIKSPFKKLPYYYTPTYDTTSALTSDIRFEQPANRSKTLIIGDYDESQDLESVIDYRPSGVGEYDGSMLNTYLMEEAGKILNCNVNDRWAIVKPCLRKGKDLRGKVFFGTTVEFMDSSGKGGKAYKKLFYESDFNQRQPDGRTKSGLYVCFLPGDCAHESFLDKWGHPLREEAKKWILLERESYKDNPKELSGLIRRFPLYIKEIFYINTDRCEFNATILQDRKSELESMSTPILTKGEFYWLDNKRFTEVRFRHNPHTGWCWVHSLINDIKETNLVQRNISSSMPTFGPMNNMKFISGVDPVDHGVVIEGKGGDEEFVSTRRSRPVLFVKRKYDSAIDGIVTQEILEQRAKEKYQYKTNRYIAMMDVRPNDPNVFYERALMMMWYFGCSLHPESQKPGIINYFYEQGCGEFILNKYVAESGYKRNTTMDGTPASQPIIQEYTGALATYVEYFGHTIPFIDLVIDLLEFTPKKTTEYDYSVAAGFTELGGKIQPKTYTQPMVDIHDFMPGFDEYGNVVN
ncbi:MAG TPA: hypothetical protein VL443_24315 [Cyclobacteriaceae bacterium]|jgi:hypothetical protein|nr:hypothetical protein [Cyclobacteriaceae bacterium]